MTIDGSKGIRKIPRSFEKISTDNIEIMTTGRIELSASGRAVAANVRRLRKARGWSLRSLSEALAKAGRGLSQDAINKIENGADEDTKRQIRRVDTDDLVALAVVFGVSPAALLVPFTQWMFDLVSVTGAGEVPAVAAWEWANGARRLTYETDRRRETQDKEFELHGQPEWLHPGGAVLPAGQQMAEGDTIVLEWDENGKPVGRHYGPEELGRRDDG
ncbi:helix-turn-helix domain-containing protein [Streptomyces maoxianensis]|uniref:Helix-turn-helix domain-containing protein n=1 Tax=Streptomyces maoxianensis TaxID=1459942 RepID=A0ABV9GAU3_9ACTN